MTENIEARYQTVLEQLIFIAHTHFDLAEIGASINALEAGKMLASQEVVTDQQRLALFLAESTILVGDYFNSPGNFDFVLERIQQTAELATNLNDQHGNAQILSLKGQLYYYRRRLTDVGKYAEAANYLEEAQKLFREIEDTRGISETFFFLGLIDEMQDKPINAQSHYKQAYELASTHGHRYEQALAARHLASTNLDTGQIKAALPYAQESLQIREELGVKRYLPYSFALLGDVYMKLSQMDEGGSEEETAAYRQEARKALEQGLAYARELHISRMEAHLEIELEQFDED
jgi:tetratricopeptide (TPR) repeat protein